jgi:hypothetical protein
MTGLRELLISAIGADALASSKPSPRAVEWVLRRACGLSNTQARRIMHTDYGTLAMTPDEAAAIEALGKRLRDEARP